MTVEQDATLGKDALNEALRSEEVKPLDDLDDLESFLYVIKDLEYQIDRLMGLRRKRTEAIDDAILKTNTRITFLKEVIFITLDKFKEKRISFPGIGSVGKRKVTPRYDVLDQGKLLKLLSEEGEYDKIVEEKTEDVVKKKELNKLLEIWDKNKKLPKFIDKIVQKHPLTLKFDDDGNDGKASSKDTEEVGQLDFAK